MGHRKYVVKDAVGANYRYYITTYLITRLTKYELGINRSTQEISSVLPMEHHFPADVTRQRCSSRML